MKDFLIVALLAVVVYIWFGKRKTVAPTESNLPQSVPAAAPGSITQSAGLFYKDGEVVGSVFKYKVPKTILNNSIANGL